MAVFIMRCRDALAVVLLFVLAGAVGAAEIGQIKVAKGQVSIETPGARRSPRPSACDCKRQTLIKTGADGSVGITMDDDSCCRQDQQRALARSLIFDTTTNRGDSTPSLNKGTPAVISGPHCQAVPGRNDGAHADRHPRCAWHRVRREHQ
jgi:hypothetical protein